MTELKPCPFCGSSNIIVELYVTGCNVKCKSCGAEGPIIPNYANGRQKEQAITAWNTRAKEPINDR